MDYIKCGFEFKADDSTRTFYGYGAIFGNIDSYGDVIAPGAFTKTIASANSGATAYPAMLLQHGGNSALDQTPIGIWTSLEEDNKGLKLVGQLAIKTRRGREAYELLRMKPRPALNGLSIGYRCTDYEMHGKKDEARRIIKAADLVEVSLVTFPADQYARVTSVKSHAVPVPVVAPYTFRDLALANFLELRKLSNTHRVGR